MRNLLILVVNLFCYFVITCCQAEQLPLLVQDSFEEGMSLWETSDPESGPQTWEVIQVENPDENSVLRSRGGSEYKPPHRSPWNIALLKETAVGDFVLTVRGQNTNYDAGGHRDLCIFWGYQDPAHFYYVHLGAVPDPHSCQIFIVDGADRKAITEKESKGTPWSRDWHELKVARKIESGEMAVYFDDMNEPVMTANNKKFSWGRVGIGTFDDNGNFDDFKLRGMEVTPMPAEARLPAK